VMTKNFFVVVPYIPPILNVKSGGVFSGLFGKKTTASAAETANNNFEENVAQLNQRVNVVRGGLSRVGLRNESLETEELIELYFKIFNPGETGTPTTEEAPPANSNQPRN
ncbi:MAG: hypothetical protein WC537_00715, partial [Candidatus Paceibacterota bacterium]